MPGRWWGKAPLSITQGNGCLPKRLDSIRDEDPQTGESSSVLAATGSFARTSWPKARRSLIMRLLFCILCFTLIIAGELVAAARPARSLTFRKGSSFFYRINYKIPSVPYTAIFAAAAGFKLVWQLPSGSEATRIGRSITDVHQAVELVYERMEVVPFGKLPSTRYCLFEKGTKLGLTDRPMLSARQGFNGRSCLLKNICQAMEYVSQRDGVIAKILKLLVGSYTSNSSSTGPLYCDVHVKNCPLEFIGIDDFIEQ